MYIRSSRHLAAKGAYVVMACRSLQRCDAAAAAIRDDICSDLLSADGEQQELEQEEEEEEEEEEEKEDQEQEEERKDGGASGQPHTESTLLSAGGVGQSAAARAARASAAAAAAGIKAAPKKNRSKKRDAVAAARLAVCREAVALETRQLDLGSLASVRSFAAPFATKVICIRIPAVNSVISTVDP